MRFHDDVVSSFSVVKRLLCTWRFLCYGEASRRRMLLLLHVFEQASLLFAISMPRLG